MFANDEVWVSWRFTVEERVPNLRHTNEVIGAYVTVGRGFIYIVISTDCKKKRYIVTDSILYVQPRDGHELIETGDNLGDMTSELKQSEYIAEFVSGGPNNYAYRIIDTKDDVKQLKTVILET